MVSFQYLIFITLAVSAVVAEDSNPAKDGARVKKHAYIATAPAPVLAYSAPVPATYSSYSYSTGHGYPVPAPAYPAYPATPYAAATYAAHPATYASYPSYAAYPKYVNDDGKYWPGKYEKTYYQAVYKTSAPAYPVAYHY